MSDPGRGHPREALSDYLDDELSVDARATIDRHLAECEDCRIELEALRRIARAVAEEEVPPVPVDLEARIGRSLDAATGVRSLPRARRFFIPTTIAATIAAIGILVAVQWREGHLVVPPHPEPQEKAKASDELKQSYAPVPPPSAAPEAGVAPREEREAKETASRDALQKTVAPGKEPAVEERQKQNKDEGVSAGIVSGATEQAAANDERLDRGAAKAMNQAAGAAPSRPQAPTVVPPLAANAAALSACADRWSDSGVRGTWEVVDVHIAATDLGLIAADVSGIGLWRGVADGRPYVLVVPRDRFHEVFFALRARGIDGLDAPPTLADGTDCVGISVALTAIPPSPAPAPPPTPR
jgi:hypothetical protein